MRHMASPESADDRVSVVIVSYRTPGLTVEAARSALGAGAGEVIVVDNASGDDTPARLAEVRDSRLTSISRSDNGGYGVAANAGAAHASRDVLVFLNSDAVLSSAALRALVEEVLAGDGRWLAGARLVNADGAIQPSAGLLPGPADLALRTLGLHRVAAQVARAPMVGALIRRSRIAAEYASAGAVAEPFDTSNVSGACCAIGRAAFEELGGFDERFFLYFEDADFCRRAGQAGMRIRYVPAAVVPHIGGASSSEDYHFGPAHARSMRQYLEKWYGPAGAALALALLWLRAMGFTLALRPQAGRAWKALRAAW